MKEKTSITLFGWGVVIVLMLFLFTSVQSIVNSIATLRAVNKINFETESVKRCEKMNDKFWEFTASLDNIPDTDALIARRDSLYDNICGL